MLHEAKEFLERKAKLKLKREKLLRGGKEIGKKIILCTILIF